MERRFRIVMHAPLGTRKGKLCFTRYGDSICGTLTLLGGSAPFTGRMTDDGKMEFSGTLATRLHTFRYIARGNIAGKALALQMTGSRYSFRVTGEETEEQEDNEI